MEQTWWEKWRHRIRSAMAVLTGRAYAAYNAPDMMSEVRLRMALLETRAWLLKPENIDLNGSDRVFGLVDAALNGDGVYL